MENSPQNIRGYTDTFYSVDSDVTLQWSAAAAAAAAVGDVGVLTNWRST